MTFCPGFEVARDQNAKFTLEKKNVRSIHHYVTYQKIFYLCICKMSPLFQLVGEAKLYIIYRT